MSILRGIMAVTLGLAFITIFVFLICATGAVIVLIVLGLITMIVSSVASDVAASYVFGYGVVVIAVLAWLAFFSLMITAFCVPTFDPVLRFVIRRAEPEGSTIEFEELEEEEGFGGFVQAHPWKATYSSRNRRFIAIGISSLLPLIISLAVFWVVAGTGGGPSDALAYARADVARAHERAEQQPTGPRDFDCADFATQSDAQEWLDSVGDIDGLDGDSDGVACEHLQ
jgi:hypothetical protein